MHSWLCICLLGLQSSSKRIDIRNLTKSIDIPPDDNSNQACPPVHGRLVTVYNPGKRMHGTLGMIDLLDKGCPSGTLRVEGDPKTLGCWPCHKLRFHAVPGNRVEMLSAVVDYRRYTALIEGKEPSLAFVPTNMTLVWIPPEKGSWPGLLQLDFSWTDKLKQRISQRVNLNNRTPISAKADTSSSSYFVQLSAGGNTVDFRAPRSSNHAGPAEVLTIYEPFKDTLEYTGIFREFMFVNELVAKLVEKQSDTLDHLQDDTVVKCVLPLTDGQHAGGQCFPSHMCKLSTDSQECTAVEGDVELSQAWDNLVEDVRLQINKSGFDSTKNLLPGDITATLKWITDTEMLINSLPDEHIWFQTLPHFVSLVTSKNASQELLNLTKMSTTLMEKVVSEQTNLVDCNLSRQLESNMTQKVDVTQINKIAECLDSANVTGAASSFLQTENPLGFLLAPIKHYAGAYAKDYLFFDVAGELYQGTTWSLALSFHASLNAIMSHFVLLMLQGGVALLGLRGLAKGIRLFVKRIMKRRLPVWLEKVLDRSEKWIEGFQFGWFNFGVYTGNMWRVVGPTSTIHKAVMGVNNFGPAGVYADMNGAYESWALMGTPIFGSTSYCTAAPKSLETAAHLFWPQFDYMTAESSEFKKKSSSNRPASRPSPNEVETDKCNSFKERVVRHCVKFWNETRLPPSFLTMRHAWKMMVPALGIVAHQLFKSHFGGVGNVGDAVISAASAMHAQQLMNLTPLHDTFWHPVKQELGNWNMACESSLNEMWYSEENVNTFNFTHLLVPLVAWGDIKFEKCLDSLSFWTGFSHTLFSYDALEVMTESTNSKDVEHATTGLGQIMRDGNWFRPCHRTRSDSRFFTHISQFFAYRMDLSLKHFATRRNLHFSPVQTAFQDPATAMKIFIHVNKPYDKLKESFLWKYEADIIGKACQKVWYKHFFTQVEGPLCTILYVDYRSQCGQGITDLHEKIVNASRSSENKSYVERWSCVCADPPDGQKSDSCQQRELRPLRLPSFGGMINTKDVVLQGMIDDAKKGLEKLRDVNPKLKDNSSFLEAVHNTGEWPPLTAQTSPLTTTTTTTTSGTTVQACWQSGSRVRLIPCSRFADQNHVCATLTGELCPDGTWMRVTFDDGFQQNYQHQDFRACEVKCNQTIYTEGKINVAFVEQFVASNESGECHCRDKDTLKDKLPPHTMMNRCGEADCWEYYRNVMSTVVDCKSGMSSWSANQANFWSADQACPPWVPPCGGVNQPKCDETFVDRNFGAYDLVELKVEAQIDMTGKKLQELDAIIDALRTQGILDISYTILTDSEKDAFRWVTADLKCSKSCADENGSGVQIGGKYVCEKLADGSSSNGWKRVGDSECEKKEGPAPKLGACATTVCRAAWTVEANLGSIKEKLDLEVKTVLPEGIKPSPEPYLVDITQLMPKVEAEGLRCCCDKDKKGFGTIKDILRGIGDRSNYCVLTKEIKCGDVIVTADTIMSHSYDKTDGKCEILNSTLDELKSMIDITEPELVSAIVEDTWQPCDHKCLEKDETLEDAKQFRPVQCVIENGAGNWEYRSAEACEKLIPGATKPVESRMCSVPPVPCYKCVVGQNFGASEKDTFRWVTAEDPKCSKSCADENGSGVQIGGYVCEKLADGFSSNSWERVDDSECEKEECPAPELGACATTVCRAAWTVQADLGSIKEKLDIEVKTALPEGIKPSLEPYLVDITQLMPKVEAEGLRCCCDKDKKGFGTIKDALLRGIGDRSNYCILSKESKCGNVSVTADTIIAHSYDKTDGKCEILKSTLDLLKSAIDITEPELVSAIVEDTWQPCDHKCLEKDETLEDAKQFRLVQCVIEDGAGNWEYRSAEACEKLIPGATKPVESRMCSVPPVPCYKCVVGQNFGASEKDTFRWVTAEDLKCSKSCADENGPGVQIGEYVCEKLADGSSSNSWKRVGDSECEKKEGPAPELGACATTVCRAAWTVQADLGSIKEKLDIEVKTALPEGIKPSPEPYLVDITQLMPKVEAEGLRCCCDKDKKSIWGIKDVLRGIGDRSNYCVLTKESKCGDVIVTADTIMSHSYDKTDGKCEILKSTLDELKSMIDITEPELVSAIVEDAWQPCDHKCLEKDETLEDAKQFRPVQCVIENGAGNWEYRSAEACEKLIPGATKPVESRMCSVPPIPCYKWVVVTQCGHHEGNVMEDAKCDGLEKPSET